ncbi:MAG TPA: hypothetical protein VFA70_08745 [Dehalococcoidia bacterium]|nr:hypothetical protein [Dehalococcoidia bacterium]
MPETTTGTPTPSATLAWRGALIVAPPEDELLALAIVGAGRVEGGAVLAPFCETMWQPGPLPPLQAH